MRLILHNLSIYQTNTCLAILFICGILFRDYIIIIANVHR